MRYNAGFCALSFLQRRNKLLRFHPYLRSLCYLKHLQSSQPKTPRFSSTMASLLQSLGLMAKPPDPVEQAKEWQKKIKSESRQCDREIRDLEREEQRFIKEVKKAAKLGTRGGSAVKILAKSVVMARRAKEKAFITRAQLNSVGMTLTHQIAIIKMSHCMEKSAEVMMAMNNLVKLPQLNANMLEMARQMEKAGLIEELIGDAMSDAMGGEELESEADAEVDKVLKELTEGMFGEGTEVASSKLPAKKQDIQQEEEAAQEVVEESTSSEAAEDLNEMRMRLQAL